MFFIKNNGIIIIVMDMREKVLLNNKGFAISIILYTIVLLIIAILYMLLEIEKNRYTVNEGLRNSIIEQLNENE